MGLGEVESLRKDYEIRLDWRPYLLRPDAPETGWPLPEHLKAKVRSKDNPLQARAKALGLALVERDHIPNSRRAHECAEFARSHGQLESFHRQVIERYWSRGEDLHEWTVLRGAAVEAGLDADAMQREVEAGRWTDAVQASLDEAAELGIHAVPTFLVGERFAIQGAQSADVFRHAFSRL
ncbi:MAG: DsbA family protein [Myxococcota bacterium]